MSGSDFSNDGRNPIRKAGKKPYKSDRILPNPIDPKVNPEIPPSSPDERPDERSKSKYPFERPDERP